MTPKPKNEIRFCFINFNLPLFTCNDDTEKKRYSYLWLVKLSLDVAMGPNHSIQLRFVNFAKTSNTNLWNQWWIYLNWTLNVIVIWWHTFGLVVNQNIIVWENPVPTVGWRTNLNVHLQHTQSWGITQIAKLIVIEYTDHGNVFPKES